MRKILTISRALLIALIAFTSLNAYSQQNRQQNSGAPTKPEIYAQHVNACQNSKIYSKYERVKADHVVLIVKSYMANSLDGSCNPYETFDCRTLKYKTQCLDDSEILEVYREEDESDYRN